MIDGSPDDDAWLAQLVTRSPLLPEPSLRRHWRTLIPWLPKSIRYELAAVLLETEQALDHARAQKSSPRRASAGSPRPAPGVSGPSVPR